MNKKKPLYLNKGFLSKSLDWKLNKTPPLIMVLLNPN